MLGARIALLRRQAGLSQRALAAALKVSASAVGMYEQERRVPSTELLVQMARLFGVTTDFLLTGRSHLHDAPALKRVGQLAAQELEGLPPQDAALIASVLLTQELTDGEKSAMIEKKGGGQMTDRDYMAQALDLARQAQAEGEVPVGCVIVDGDRVVGRGRNRREGGKNALCHAELEAINEACTTLGGWRLWRCTMYVTLEPCPMCAGAIVNARLARVVCGAADAKSGACGSLIDVLKLPGQYHPRYESGLMAEEATALLQAFFKHLRENPTVKAWKKPK